jgi:flagellar FliL protein
MAKPAKPAAGKKEEVVAEAPKSKKKLIIIGVVSVLLIAGGAGWYLSKDKNAAHDEPKAEVRLDPIFIPMDAFTVNLQHEEADQYLQATFSLKVMEPELVEKIKAVLPEIRSKLNLLLSSKRPSELSTVEGKKKLAEEIVVETNNVLGIHNAAAHAAAPVPAPVVVSEVVAASAPAEGEAPAEPVAEGQPESAPAPAPATPATPEKKGVVDVLFTSFIIQ